MEGRGGRDEGWRGREGGMKGGGEGEGEGGCVHVGISILYTLRIYTCYWKRASERNMFEHIVVCIETCPLAHLPF